MSEKCQFPEFLKGQEPHQCSPEQMRKCHELSGGVHPLPEEDLQENTEEKKEKK